MQSFHNLRVTVRIRELTVVVYRLTAHFPPEERFGLVAQMRRAAISIGANVAEGCGREGDRALAAFLQIAMGSLLELEFESLAAFDLHFLPRQEHDELSRAISHVKRMLGRLILHLRRQHPGSAMRRLSAAARAEARTDRREIRTAEEPRMQGSAAYRS